MKTMFANTWVAIL